MEELKWKDWQWLRSNCTQSNFSLASFPGLPTVQFLISCSMHKTEGQLEGLGMRLSSPTIQFLISIFTSVLRSTNYELRLEVPTLWRTYQARPSSPSRKVREGLADVISVHEMLINQILLFNFETVATPSLQLASFPGLAGRAWEWGYASICKTNPGAVVGLQIKQAVNYEY